jgi:hypothetical protein
MSDVVGHQRASEGHGVGGDQGVEFSNGRPAIGKEAADSAEFGGGRLVERRDLHGRGEGIGEGAELAGALSVRPIAELGEGDGADTDIGRSLGLEACPDFALTECAATVPRRSRLRAQEQIG